MMYMHYCKRCHRIFMLNGHKMICPKCADPLTELQISYLDYVDLDMAQREAYKNACEIRNGSPGSALLIECISTASGIRSFNHKTQLIFPLPLYWLPKHKGM